MLVFLGVIKCAKKDGYLPLTDKRMTRFNISLHEGAQIVDWAIHNSKGGEIIVEGIPEDVAKHPTSHTAKYLKKVLK